MSSKWEFPKEIERWCCAGKSCGNTKLELISSGANTEPVLYNYVRVTNGNEYSGWKTEEQMERWLEETKDHIQEELDQLKSVYPNVGIMQVIKEPNEFGGVNETYSYDAKKYWNKLSEQIKEAKVDNSDIGQSNSQLLPDKFWLRAIDNIRAMNKLSPLLIAYTTTGLTEEFIEKRQKLAEFLLEMATGLQWHMVTEDEGYHSNYMKDADDILRANPHLLGLTTRESMNLD